MDYLLDTSFLVGLWRQRGQGPEAQFLEGGEGIALALPWIARAEFLSGAVIAEHDLPRVLAFLDGFPLIWPDEAVVLRYARANAALRAARLAVGANDLWIAATALERDLSLLTRNVREFQRVDGLRVIDYAQV